MYRYYAWPVYYWAVPPLAMMGGEAQQVPAAPRVLTRTTAAGDARACLGGGTFRYRPGVSVEVVRSRRLREGLFYLVVTPDGCAGWVPAAHLAIRRRSPGGGSESEGDVEIDFGDLEEE